MSTPTPATIVAALAKGQSLDAWWPVDRSYHEAHGTDPREEVVIGAVLVQNTAWRQTQRALVALKEADALDLVSVRDMPLDRLAALVRPAGFVTRKPRTLQDLADLILQEGGMAVLAEQAEDDPDPVRRLLLEVHGIGEETADAILNFALDAPVFVVDAYTRRLMARLGVTLADAQGRTRDPLTAPYGLVQRWWMSGLPRDAEALRLAHAAIVHHAQSTCRKTPDCPTCPLQGPCPSAPS